MQRIVKHPAYIEMEKVPAVRPGLAAISHREDMLGWKGKMRRPSSVRADDLFEQQSEFGLCCPLSMTDSLTRTLRKYGDEAGRQIPAQAAGHGLLIRPLQGLDVHDRAGGGSDISNTLTMAYPQEDGSWRLYGEKWFCSNPDAGFGMVLARGGRAARHEGHLAVPAAASV